MRGRRFQVPAAPEPTPFPLGDCLLLAEDDSYYADFIQLAAQDAGIQNPVELVEDGFQAVRSLLSARQAWKRRQRHELALSFGSEVLQAEIRQVLHGYSLWSNALGEVVDFAA